MYKICDISKKKKKKEKFFIENEELNQSVLEKELFTSIKG